MIYCWHLKLVLIQIQCMSCLSIVHLAKSHVLDLYRRVFLFFIWPTLFFLMDALMTSFLPLASKDLNLNIFEEMCTPCTMKAEIVETIFVLSRFSDIRKETTSFLVIPKRNNQKQCLFSVISAQKQPEMTKNELVRG